MLGMQAHTIATVISRFDQRATSKTPQAGFSDSWNRLKASRRTMEMMVALGDSPGNGVSGRRGGDEVEGRDTLMVKK
jgi:hypothetical protein